ncbi:MAG: efflux RND transporter periplasmic adaptor subunit [Gemmatimonadaceae bacterium]
MKHDSTHDDATNDTARTGSNDDTYRAEVSSDTVRDWKPRAGHRGGGSHWYARPQTLLLVIAALIIVVLVAVLFRRGVVTQEVTPATPSSASAMQGMVGMQTSSDGSVALTPDQIRQFGVTFGTAEQRTLTNDVRTAGIVAADETRLTSVTPRFSGYIERLHVNSLGQPVHKGQPLATVYSPDVLAAEQELLLARGLDQNLATSSVPGVASSPTEFVNVARRRLQLLDVSNAQIEQVLRTGKPSPTVTLYSPASGVVTEIKVIRGQAIQSGVDLYTITDLSQVWVDAEIREGDAALVHIGAPATLALTAYPDKQYAARVSFIYPTVTAQSRTLRARIVVGNKDGMLKPGMYATVNLTAPTRSALTVPSAAVVHTGEHSLVFFDIGGGKLVPHELRVGRTSGDYTEVLAGIAAGQRVVTSAQFLIDSESNLGEVMRSMISTGENSGTSTNSGKSSGSAGDMKGMPGMSAGPTTAPR